MMVVQEWISMCLLATTLGAVLGVGLAQEETSVTIRTKTPSHTVSDRFISLSVDPTVLLQNDISPTLAKIISFLQGLSPAYIRIGGPGTNNYQYLRSRSDMNQTTITEEQWVIFNEFAQHNGLEPVVCLNALARLDGHWDPSNAVELIAFSARMKYKLGWQLGYELQSTGSPITGEQFGKDYASFRSILRTFPSYANATIVGPDMTRYQDVNDVGFLTTLFHTAGDAVSSVIWHPNTPAGSVANLETLVADIYKEKDLVSQRLGDQLGDKDVWLDENEFERAASKGEYADALSWALKLGTAASLGVQVVLKHPGMVHFHHPTPDYWISFLHKSLVGRVVLENRMNGPDSSVQVYSHCARTNTGGSPSRYAPGAMTLFGVNPLPHRVSLVLRTDAWQGDQRLSEVHQFAVTSTDMQEPLNAKNVVLNGHLLSMDKVGSLPALSPEVIPFHGDLSLNLPGYSVVFWVFPNANISACLVQDTDAIGSIPTSFQARALGDEDVEKVDIHDDVEKVDAVEDIVAESSEVQGGTETSSTETEEATPTKEQVMNSFQGIGRLDKNSTVSGLLHDMLESANPFPLTSPQDGANANHSAAKVITDKDWEDIKDKYLISKFMFVLKRDPKTLRDRSTPLTDQEIITVSNDETFGQRFSRALEDGLYTIPGLDLKLYQPASFKSPLQAMNEPLVESLMKPLESLKRLREERWEKLQMKKLEDDVEEEQVKASLAVPGTLFAAERQVEATTRRIDEYVYVDEGAHPEGDYEIDEEKVAQRFPANGPWEIYEGLGMKTRKLRNKHRDYGELWAAEGVVEDKAETEEQKETEVIEKQEMTPMEVKEVARKVAKAQKKQVDKKLKEESKSQDAEKRKEKSGKKATQAASKEDEVVDAGKETTAATDERQEHLEIELIGGGEGKQKHDDEIEKRRRRRDAPTDGADDHTETEQLLEDISVHVDDEEIPEAPPPPPPPPPQPPHQHNDHLSVIKSLISIHKDASKKPWIESTMKLNAKDPHTHVMNINEYNEALRAANETAKLMAQIAASGNDAVVGEESQVAHVALEDPVDETASAETTTRPKDTKLFAEDFGKEVSKKLKDSAFMRRLQGDRKPSVSKEADQGEGSTTGEATETTTTEAATEGDEVTESAPSSTTRMSLLSALGLGNAAGKKKDKIDEAAIDLQLDEEVENQSTVKERNVRESKAVVMETEDIDAKIVDGAADGAVGRNVRENRVISTKISPDKTPVVEIKTISIARRPNDLDLASLRLPGLVKLAEIGDIPKPILPEIPKFAEIPLPPAATVDLPDRVSINQLGERFGATARKAKENAEGAAKRMKEMAEGRLKSGRVFQARNNENSVPTVHENLPEDTAGNELKKLEKSVSEFAKYNRKLPVASNAAETPKKVPVSPGVSSEIKKLRERIFNMFDKNNPKERKMLPKLAKELASVEQSLRSKVAPPPRFELRPNPAPAFPKFREMVARSMSTVAPAKFPLAGLRRTPELQAAAPLPTPFWKYSLAKFEPSTTPQPAPKDVIKSQARSFASDIQNFAGKVSKQFQEIPQVDHIVSKTKDYLGDMNQELKKDVKEVAKKFKDIPESVGESFKDNAQINAAVSKTKELISKIDEDLKVFRSAPAPAPAPASGHGRAMEVQNQLDATNVAVKDKLDGVVRRMEEINTDIRDAIIQRRPKRSVGRRSAKANLLSSKLLDEEIYNADSHNLKRNFRKSLRYHSYGASSEKHVISRRDVLKDDAKLVSYLILRKPVQVDKVKKPIVYRYSSESDDEELDRLRGQLKTMKENRKNAIDELLNESQTSNDFPTWDLNDRSEYLNVKDDFAPSYVNSFDGSYDDALYDDGDFDLERMKRQIPQMSRNEEVYEDSDRKLVVKRGIYDNRVDDESIERRPVLIKPSLDKSNSDGLNFLSKMASKTAKKSEENPREFQPTQRIANPFLRWNMNVFPEETVHDITLKNSDVGLQSQIVHSLDVDFGPTSVAPLKKESQVERGQISAVVDATGEEKKTPGIFRRFVNRLKNLFGEPETTHVET